MAPVQQTVGIDYGYTTNTATTTTCVWNQWNQIYYVMSSPITTSAATTNNLVWTAWSTQMTTATNQIIATAWTNWNDAYLREVATNVKAGRKPTQAELRADEERRERFRAAEAKRVAQLDGANRRAEDLLRRHLTDEQRKDLDSKRCFYLESIARDGTRRRYRIDYGTHGNIKLLDEKGSIKGTYCVQPLNVPVADSMLAQKLWIEGDEEGFKRAANWRAAA